MHLFLLWASESYSSSELKKKEHWRFYIFNICNSKKYIMISSWRFLTPDAEQKYKGMSLLF